jgi:hypothetical protein
MGIAHRLACQLFGQFAARDFDIDQFTREAPVRLRRMIAGSDFNNDASAIDERQSCFR